MNSDLTELFLRLGISPRLFIAFFIILLIIVIWSTIWKGFALWKAARRNSLVWFIVLLVVNTVGILEILYLFVFSEIGRKKSESIRTARRRRR